MEKVDTRAIERQLQVILYTLSEESQNMVGKIGRIDSLDKYGASSELLDQIKHDLETDLHHMERFLDFILKTMPIVYINGKVI